MRRNDFSITAVPPMVAISIQIRRAYQVVLARGSLAAHSEEQSAYSAIGVVQSAWPLRPPHAAGRSAIMGPGSKLC